MRGVQVRELLLENIDWKKNLISFNAVKNGNEIKQPILPEIGNVLMDYILNVRPNFDRSRNVRHNHVFLSIMPPHKPIKYSDTLSKIISKFLDKSGIKMPHGSLRGSHIFRHTFASRLLSKGESIKNISDMLGHKFYDTTMIYTKPERPARWTL